MFHNLGTFDENFTNFERKRNKSLNDHQLAIYFIRIGQRQIDSSLLPTLTSEIFI